MTDSLAVCYPVTWAGDEPDLEAEQFPIDLKNCARCGETHEGLIFVALTRPGLAFGVHLTHWAICPSVHEPVLFYWKEDPEVETVTGEECEPSS